MISILASRNDRLIVSDRIADPMIPNLPILDNRTQAFAHRSHNKHLGLHPISHIFIAIKIPNIEAENPSISVIDGFEPLSWFSYIQGPSKAVMVEVGAGRKFGHYLRSITPCLCTIYQKNVKFDNQ